MATTLIIICSAYVLALAVLVIEMVTAPVGYQDEGGFHPGEEPVSEVEVASHEIATALPVLSESRR